MKRILVFLSLALIIGCHAAFGQSTAPPSNNWNVQGFGTNGSAAVGTPVFVGGWDGTNLRALKTDSTGQLLVSGGGGGGGSVTQGTTPWVTSLFGVNGTSIATNANPFPVSVQSSALPTGAAQDATLTGGTQKTQLVSSGGNAAAVDTAGNLQVKTAVTEIAGTAATTVGTDVIAATNVSDDTWASFHYSAGTGTFTFQASNDNVNYVNVLATNAGAPSVPAVTAAATGIYYFSINFKWLRVRVTATAASVSATLELYTVPRAQNNSAVNASQSGSPWGVSQTPAISGGLTIGKVLAAASTNATSLKASAGQIYSYTLSNVAASFRYVHIYNLATAPTVGTSVPVFTLGIPAGGALSWHDSDGIAFATGIAYSITTGAADTDSTAVTANDVMGIIAYKFCLPMSIQRFRTIHKSGKRKIRTYAV